MFKQKLYNILSDLNKNIPRDELFKECVQRKLDLSLERYNNEIELIYNYLLSRSNIKVMRNIAKMKDK